MPPCLALWIPLRMILNGHDLSCWSVSLLKAKNGAVKSKMDKVVIKLQCCLGSEGRGIEQDSLVWHLVNAVELSKQTL